MDVVYNHVFHHETSNFEKSFQATILGNTMMVLTVKVQDVVMTLHLKGL